MESELMPLKSKKLSKNLSLCSLPSPLNSLRGNPFEPVLNLKIYLNENTT